MEKIRINNTDVVAVKYFNKDILNDNISVDVDMSDSLTEDIIKEMLADFKTTGSVSIDLFRDEDETVSGNVLSESATLLETMSSLKVTSCNVNYVEGSKMMYLSFENL